MAVVVADCPRCRANKMTMDVRQSHLIRLEHGWVPTFETFCICRNCNRSSIFLLEITDFEFAKISGANREIHSFDGSLNRYLTGDADNYICIRDMGEQRSPEFVPDDVASAFNQGATAFAVKCWDAAAAMFRKSVDLATRPLLPTEESPGLNSKTRRDLGLRLPWLFANQKLPGDLQELSTCIREDGNDGAHAGSLEKPEAEDLLDFTNALLERLFTEPERLKLAKIRRDKRRQTE